MTAPKVQKLADIAAELNPIYAGQETALNAERAGLGAKFDSQRASLGAEKVQGFNLINDNAQAKGMAFSGIPAHEQANYLSTKYLPGMQNLTFQQNDADIQLQKSLAALAGEKQLKALDIRNTQQGRLDTYLLAQAQAKWAAEEAAKERAWREKQNAIDRASSGGGGSGSSPYMSMQDGLMQMGSTYRNADGRQIFISGYNKDGSPIAQTREQAAYSLAAATGVDYNTALKNIYSTFPDGAKKATTTSKSASKSTAKAPAKKTVTSPLVPSWARF